MPIRKIRDPHDARSCLDAARASGLPRAQWARAHGIDARSLNAWRLNLERPHRNPNVALSFLELLPTQHSRTETDPPPIRLVRHDLVLEVPHHFDEDHLRRVLRVVAAC